MIIEYLGDDKKHAVHVHEITKVVVELTTHIAYS
jgi:hypothetical protein